MTPPPSTSLVRLGRALRHFRERTELSQEVFAQRAGMHRTYVSQLERGLANPSFQVLERFLSTAGAGWSDLAEWLDGRRS